MTDFLAPDGCVRAGCRGRLGDPRETCECGRMWWCCGICKALDGIDHDRVCKVMAGDPATGATSIEWVTILKGFKSVVDKVVDGNQGGGSGVTDEGRPWKARRNEPPREGSPRVGLCSPQEMSVPVAFLWSEQAKEWSQRLTQRERAMATVEREVLAFVVPRKR